MKNIFILILLSGLCPLQAQSRMADNWLLASSNPSVNGYCTWLRFGNGGMSVDSFRCNTQFQECSASISDEDGNLLFYTNGIAVFNAQGDTMQNGKNFNPGYFTDMFAHNGSPLDQSCMILPAPGDPHLYYLFHLSSNKVNNMYIATPLKYSVVDMTQDGGKGAVVSKNQIAIADTVGILLTATRHANGRDWWVVTTRPNRPGMFALLLNSEGLQPVQPQYLPMPDWGAAHTDGAGQPVFSPDGSRYAKWDNKTKRLHVLDFDRCAGTFGNPLVLTTPLINLPDSTANPYGFYGLAFSPSGRLLYLNKNNHIEQYDLSAADVQASVQVVAVYDGFLDLYGPNAFVTGFGFNMSLAPDGKIYTNAMPCRYLNVIENPDVQGPGCNVSQHSVFLGFFNNYTLPVFPNYGLGALAGSGCDTLSSVPPPTWEAALSVYPNPASTLLHVGGAPAGSQASLLDATGRELLRLYLPEGRGTLPLQGVAEGLYLLRVEGAGRSETRKVVVGR